MLNIPPVGLFITGTDTDIGKTYVSCLIAKALCARGYRVGVYKPVATGGSPADGKCVAADAVALHRAAGLSDSLADVCPQVFQAPLAPPSAAAAEGAVVDGNMLRQGLTYWAGKCDIVLVEGSGGLMSPLSDEDYSATLAEEFGYRLVVVAANRLGVINQSLQTLITAAAFGKGLEIAGVILNQLRSEGDGSILTNHKQLEERIGVPILADVAWQAKHFEPEIDWFALASQNC